MPLSEVCSGDPLRGSYALAVSRLNELGPGLIPAGLAFLVFVVLGAKDAGYPATVWYPSAMFLVALLAVSVWAGRSTFAGLPRADLASVLFLALLTVWTYVTIGWSDVKGDAWDGANRGLLYLAVYVLFLLVAPSAQGMTVILAGYVVAIGGLGIFEFVAASRSANPDSYFLIARFSEPTGYQNANCALFSLAFWPALFLASRRQLPVAMRALMLAAAGVCVELALLSQSRGWLAAMPVAFVLYVAVVPGRLRSLVCAGIVGVTVLAARGPLLDLYSALRDGSSIHRALHDARSAILFSALALIVAGLILAVVDGRMTLRDATARRLTLAVGAIVALVAISTTAVALVWLGNPVTRVRHAWAGFKSEPPAQVSGSYLTSGFSSNRYDLWRVAWHEISAHPLRGVGSDQFAVDYLRERRSDEEPLYPHSLELKVLAQTGLVGGLLFGGFLVTTIVGWRRRREESSFARAMRATAFVGFAYWFLHGSLDWFWELPGLAAPAFALLGFAVGGGAGARAAKGRGRLLSAVAVAAVLLALASLVPPWLSAQEVRAAAGQWQEDRAGAFARLDRARQLNPLSDWPDVIAGAIASRVGDDARMIVAFRRALDRNPKNWYSHLELAVAYGRVGDQARALRELAVVERLDPLEPTIPFVRSRLRAGRPVKTAELDAIFLRRNFVSNRGRRK
jgi:O-antigen ligase/polysaccharide polymerase Wzy-like membrane protein